MHPGGRIWFAQMLRGLAALLVVIDHLVLLFWQAPGIGTVVAHVAPLPAEAYELAYEPVGAALHVAHVSLGALGVAVFFIISGFVIPMSLERYRPLPFLVARGFRLLPTWLVALAIVSLVIWIATDATGFPYPIGPDIWREGVLVNDLLFQPYYNPVGWTLAVEVKFYLLCALIVAVTSLKRAPVLVGIAAALTAFSVASGPITEGLLGVDFHLGVAAVVVANLAKFLTLMFCGVAFYNHFRGFWSTRRFLVVGALLVGFQALAMPWAPDRYFWTYVCIAHGIALVIFGVGYLRRDRIPYSRSLNLLADISYPLYAVHQVAGFAFITWMYALHPVPYLNLLEGIAFVLLLSWLLHKLVEGPSNELGKRIANRLATRRTRPAPAPVPVPVPVPASAPAPAD